jgi:hypothetical protein
LITPSKDAKRKAQVSTAAGTVVGHIVGIGWKTLSGARISFKEQSPIWMITIKEHKEPNKTKVCFYFPVSARVYERDLRKMEIKPAKEGVINRKVVGVKYDFYCVGKGNICRDEELKNSLLRLFTTQELCDISDWTQTPITAEISKQDDFYVGKIEAGIQTLNEEGLKILLGSAVKIAQDINVELSERARRSAESRGLVSPSPDTEQKEQIPVIEVNTPSFNGVYLANAPPPNFNFKVTNCAGLEPLSTATLTDWLGNAAPILRDTPLPTQSGYYVLSISATDQTGRKSTSSIPFVVVDPRAGKFDTGVCQIKFVKQKDTDLECINFYFFGQYKGNSKVPEGSFNCSSHTGKPYYIKTEIRSTNMDWLVISGNQAMLQGKATVNKNIGYVFRAHAKPSNVAGGPIDYVRISVWDTPNTNLQPIFNCEGKLTTGRIKMPKA